MEDSYIRPSRDEETCYAFLGSIDTVFMMGMLPPMITAKAVVTSSRFTYLFLVLFNQKIAKSV
jgi:hypothetical protein